MISGNKGGGIKVAVATKDGISINQHFGHATSFWIYNVGDSLVSFIEKRDVELYCLGNSSSKSAMQKILTTINDCNIVFCAKIGDGPTEKLRKIGVLATSEYAYEEISESLQRYYTSDACEFS